MQDLTKVVVYDKFASDLFCTQLLGDRKTRVRERNLPSRPRLGERSAPGRVREREKEREIKKFASQTRNRQENFAMQSRNGSKQLSTKSGYRVIEIGMQQVL